LKDDLDALCDRLARRALGERVGGVSLATDLVRIVGLARSMRVRIAELEPFEASVLKRRCFARDYMARRRTGKPLDHAAALLRRKVRMMARREAADTGEPVEAIYQRWNVD